MTWTQSHEFSEYVRSSLTNWVVTESSKFVCCGFFLPIWKRWLPHQYFPAPLPGGLDRGIKGGPDPIIFGSTKKCVFNKRARFASVVLDWELLHVAQHSWQCPPWFCAVPEATHKVRLRALEGCRDSSKSLSKVRDRQKVVARKRTMPWFAPQTNWSSIPIRPPAS